MRLTAPYRGIEVCNARVTPRWSDSADGQRRSGVVEAARQADGASFVLRLWLESTGGRSGEWRWKVHHVQTGDERYFRDLMDVLDFIGERSEVGPPQPVLTRDQE